MHQARALLSAKIEVDYPGKPQALRNVSLELQCGEIVGLVGQSGSGKSTLALALLRLLHLKGAQVQGEIRFRGRNLMALKEREMRDLRGREISFVPQSPLSSLNPALRLHTQFEEIYRAHAPAGRKLERAELRNLLRSVSLPDDDAFLRKYPRQLSVGLGQRVLIAMAVLHRPSLLIADEPTSALDVITQSEILSLFASLNRELGMGILYISHDLASVATLCHRIAILNDGQVVEQGPAERILFRPEHPYTKRLLQAIPATPARMQPAG